MFGAVNSEMKVRGVRSNERQLIHKREDFAGSSQQKERTDSGIGGPDSLVDF